MLFDFEVAEHDNGKSALTLVRADGMRLVSDMAELEPLTWHVLAEMLPRDRAARAAVRGRSTGAPGIVLNTCLTADEKTATFEAPACGTLRGILQAWGLRVREGSPSAPAHVDACCLDVAGMDPPRAREALRAAAASVAADGWLVARGADPGMVADCLQQQDEFRAVVLDEPYGNGVSVCHRDSQQLHRFCCHLDALVKRAGGEQ